MTVQKIRPPFVKRLVVLLIVFDSVFVGIPLLYIISVALGRIPGYIIIDPTLFYLLTGLLMLVLASVVATVYGLWNMKPWARKVAIGTVIASILCGVLIIGLIVFWRALSNLMKPETNAAFGEKLSRNEAEKLKHKVPSKGEVAELRKAKRICEECGAKDVLLHELENGKLVCYECLKKARGSSTKGK